MTHILAEELQQRGFNTWYAFKCSDSDVIPESRKICIDGIHSGREMADRLIGFIRANDIRLIICQNYYPKPLRQAFPEIIKATGVRLATCLHMSPDSFFRYSPFSTKFIKNYTIDVKRRIDRILFGERRVRRMRYMHSISDRFVLLSDRYIPVFMRVTGVDSPEKLVGINNPLTFDEKPQSAAKEQTIVVVSRLIEEPKRISLVLKAWQQLCPAHPGWRLRIVGDGSDMNRYRDMAAAMRLDRLEFVGHSDDVSSFYSTASIFLMTSLYEGLPMTMIEAQSAGCVPVAFDSFAAIRDIIADDGSNGIIVPDKDLDALVRATGALMTDPGRLRRMSLNAMETSRRTFSRERILSAWESLFESLEGRDS